VNLIRAVAVAIVALILIGVFLRGHQETHVPVGAMLVVLVITLVVILVRDAPERPH
jgi:hypothetical membrane protein